VVDELAHQLETTKNPKLEWRTEGAWCDLELGGRGARTRAMTELVAQLRVPPQEQQRRLASSGTRWCVADAAPCRLATWDEARALIVAGMEIGAHTLNHPFLGLLEADAQHAEIAGSVSLLSERLGVSVQGLAYPGGDYDASSMSAARAAGLRYAVTTRAGDNAANAPSFELSRRGLSEGACLGPGGRFSQRLAIAELDGAFDALRARRASAEVRHERRVARESSSSSATSSPAGGAASARVVEQDRSHALRRRDRVLPNEGQFAAEVNALGWPVHELACRAGSTIRAAAASRAPPPSRSRLPSRCDSRLSVSGRICSPCSRDVCAACRRYMVAKRNVDAFETKRQVGSSRGSIVGDARDRRERERRGHGRPARRAARSRDGDSERRRRRALRHRRRRCRAPAPRHERRRADPGQRRLSCPRKDYATLLDALALLSAHGQPYQAALIGDGPERERLEARANVLGIAERVHFLGERADVERLLPGLEVFVLSSREEGIPNALLEAMAAGRPAVATAVGGTPEVLQDGETVGSCLRSSPSASPKHSNRRSRTRRSAHVAGGTRATMRSRR
jgi:hypothetical protein